MKKLCNLLFVLLTLCVFPQDACANAGLPMIMFMEYWFVLLFIPIILIETWVFKKYIPDVESIKVAKANICANLFSTFIGIPITWGILLAVQFLLGGSYAYGLKTFGWQLYAVTVQAPWLIPYEANFYWILPAATMVLLVPFFFVSVWTEGWINKKFFKTQDSKHIDLITYKANRASYAFLYGCTLGGLIYGIFTR